MVLERFHADWKRSSFVLQASSGPIAPHRAQRDGNPVTRSRNRKRFQSSAICSEGMKGPPDLYKLTPLDADLNAMEWIHGETLCPPNAEEASRRPANANLGVGSGRSLAQFGTAPASDRNHTART